MLSTICCNLWLNGGTRSPGSNCPFSSVVSINIYGVRAGAVSLFFHTATTKKFTDENISFCFIGCHTSLLLRHIFAFCQGVLRKKLQENKCRLRKFVCIQRRLYGNCRFARGREYLLRLQHSR